MVVCFQYICTLPLGRSGDTNGRTTMNSAATSATTSRNAFRIGTRTVPALVGDSRTPTCGANADGGAGGVAATAR